MNRLLSIVALVSGMLCLLCGALAFSNYRLFYEGTLDGRQQIVHESWRIQSAQRYGIAACGLAIIPLAWMFWPKGSDRRKSETFPG